jgi:hypothetical protein
MLIASNHRALIVSPLPPITYKHEKLDNINWEIIEVFLIFFKF